MNEYFMIGKRDVPYNAWIGTTVELPQYRWRIEELRDIKTDSLKFLSCEPLLDDLGELDLTGIDWVIVGGESGNQARPMRKEWVLNIMHQCKEQEVSFFFKQWGTWGEDGIKRSKKANGHTISGKTIQEMPNISRSIGLKG